MAEIFDVDVGYLIGEIDYERYSMQKISDITGFFDTVKNNVVQWFTDRKQDVEDLMSEIGFITKRKAILG